MARMTDIQTIGANAQVDNVIAGKGAEFLSEDSVIRLLAVAAAAGIRTTFMVGGEAIVQDQEISGVNRFPIFPDDTVAEGAGFGGDRILVSMRNTTGAGIAVTTIVDIEPVN